MELIYDLERGILEKDGVEVCLCQGEPEYGFEPAKLGTHFGCRNLVRLIAASWLVNDVKGVTVTVIKVFPEQEKKELAANGKKMVYQMDLTKIEFWTDIKVLETTWMRLNSVMKGKFQQIKKGVEGLDLSKIIEENTGKRCRGLNFKYLPTYRELKIQDDQMKKIMEDVQKLSYEQVAAEYIKKYGPIERPMEAEKKMEAEKMEAMEPRMESPMPDPVSQDPKE